MKNHLISQDNSLLQALKQINDLAPEPLVLFVVDDEERMVGTRTDGDVRRALIKGASLDDHLEKVMHREFNFLLQGVNDDVRHIQQQRDKKMKLVPVLDENHHICDVLDLERFRTRLPIDAVIMAGGKGERLRPLTEKTPKPLLKVGDKCIIDYNIDNLISCGIDHISVTVNYLKEQIEQHYEQPRNGITVRTVREPNYLGTIGSVLFVKEFHHDTVLVMNSDLFTNINLEDFYLHFREFDADLSVAAVPYSINVPYGIFQIENKREILGIMEKPTYTYYANAGIYLIKREIIDSFIPKDTFFNATDLIEALIRAKRKVIRFPLSGYWIDIGNKQEFEKAQDLARHL